MTIYSRVVTVLMGETGCALRMRDQEPGFGCHRAVKVSQGFKKPLRGKKCRISVPLRQVLVPPFSFLC